MCRNGSADWGTSSSLFSSPQLSALGLPALLAARIFPFSSPLVLVVVLSIVIGLLMVVLFGYTSNQKAIGVAKDQLKAHLLAVRLFQDQLHVVVGSYGRILRGTARYLRLAFMPLLYVIIPLTLLIIQLDRYLGLTAFQPNVPFLLTVKANSGDVLDGISIELPPEIAVSAPAVHVAADREVTWRLMASTPGTYDLHLHAASDKASKIVRVSPDLERLSPVRFRGHFWERLFYSAEPALPDGSPFEAITVSYAERTIELAGYEINWIWLFFILSMVAGYIFKELLGIKI